MRGETKEKKEIRRKTKENEFEKFKTVRERELEEGC